MNYDTYSEKLNYLEEIVEKDGLKSIQQAATKLGCSESTIKRMIVKIRKKGIDLYYCNKSKKFIRKGME